MSKRSNAIIYYYEKFKAFLLVFLIIVCMVQVGILWSSQSGSFPFLSSFFSNSKAVSQASLEDMKGKYMLPYKVVLSEGYDDDHFIVPNGSKQYGELWEGAKEYLSAALRNKPDKTQPFSEDKWGIIVANNKYYFEFRTEMSIDIVKWVLNISNSTETIRGINKIVICPDDPENGYSDTVYIRDNTNIYTYIVTDYNGNALNQQEFNSIYNNFKNNTKTLNYKTAIEIGSKTPLPKDMIAPLTANSDEEYPDIKNTPFAGLQGHTSSLAEYDAIQMELLGEVRNDYYPDEDVYGSVVFKKSDSVYRLYKNSVIEYKLIGSQGITEKAKLLEAYQKAVGFIMEIKARSRYMNDINIYLSSVKPGNNTYIFKFDYSIVNDNAHGEVPLLLKDFKLPTGEQPLDSAFTIEATSKKVVQARWLALKLEADKNLKKYSWNFPEFVNKAYNTDKQLSTKNLPIRDYGIYYVLTPQKLNGEPVSPSFVLFNSAGSYDMLLEGQ